MYILNNYIFAKNKNKKLIKKSDTNYFFIKIKSQIMYLAEN